MEYNLFKKTKGFSVSFQYFKFEGRDGGGGGTLMSLYTERKGIKLLYCLNAVSCFKEWYYY